MDDRKDSVFGKLLARLGAEEARRFGVHGGDPSLGDRFSEVRDAAWKVVVKETLKPMLGSEKPGRVAADEYQKNSDATDALGSDSFLELPDWLCDHRGKPNEKLNATLKERKGQGLPIKTDLKSVQKRIQELATKRIPPTKELVAALLWTSAHLPLCLMTSSAAADAVREILLSLGGSEHSEALKSKEAFRQSFRVMTDKRGLKYFDKILKVMPQRAEIITGFVVQCAQVPDDASKTGCGDDTLTSVEELSLDQDTRLQALRELPAEVKRVKGAVILAHTSLLEVTGERMETKGNANQPGRPSKFVADFEKRIRQINRLRYDLRRQVFSLFKLELQLAGIPHTASSLKAAKSRLCEAMPEFPAGLYENILSKGNPGRNEAGAARSKSQQKRYEKCGLEEDISQLHPPTVPRTPEKIATLTIAKGYSGTGIENLRFRILDLENGLIAPE